MQESYEALANGFDPIGLQVPFSSPAAAPANLTDESLENIADEGFAAFEEAQEAEAAPIGRLVVRSVELLSGHRGTPPDLVLRWNDLGNAANVDVVVHFHGYSGKGASMRIDRDKETISGLDFANPKNGTGGRTRPTVAVLPRGNYFGGRSGMGYNFPKLTPPGALQSLIQFSLTKVGETVGRPLSMGRLILTGHSGGGAPLTAVLAHTDPDEIYIFDGLYGPSANVSAWARRKIALGANSGAALRVLYRPGSPQFPGTQPNSEAVGRAVLSALEDPAAQSLKPFFRVEKTTVAHNDIPATFGWRLLENAAAVFGQAKAHSAPPPNQHLNECESGSEVGLEAEGMGEGEGHAPFASVGEGEQYDETLAWLDPTREQSSGEEEETVQAFFAEGETYAADESAQGTQEQEGAYEAEAGEQEQEQEAEAESPELSRYDELGDRRDAEWENLNDESSEQEAEVEQESALNVTGLSPAEAKAVTITSTLETGRPGSFYGLSGNFDGQGVSFGLVNWTIGTGSLQVLLREFARNAPRLWDLVFRDDAASFRGLIMPNGKAAIATQLRFAVEQMNGTSIHKGKTTWFVREPWKGYFRKLADNHEFQLIQVRHVRDLLRDADHYCRSYGLISEAAFCFMFDAVSSHGKWWPRKKRRAELVREKLQELPLGAGGKPAEADVMLAISDVLAATSAGRWASKVRERKRWFVTGEHRRAHELKAFRPSLTSPYATSQDTTLQREGETGADDTPAARLIARAAEEEYLKWHPASGAFKETHDLAMPLLKKYYLEGVGQTISTEQLKSHSWQNAHPWSSVFISYVMKAAGSGQAFGRHTAHRTYIAKAKRNRVSGNGSNPFWAYSATEIAPRVGDVICKSRSGSGATYDNIDSGRGFKTHGDIVTEVHDSWIRVIGGNVNQNVDTRRPPIRTLPDGRLALDGKQSVYFAIVSCRGAAALEGQSPQPQPVPRVDPTPAPSPPPRKGKALSPAEFVAAFAAAARISQVQHGVPELVTLGQAALESGWGAHAPRFNFFGIKAKASDPETSRQLLRTHEVSKRNDLRFPKVLAVKQRPDGLYDYTVCDWFRAFPDADTAFDAHGHFLASNRRYSKAFAVKHDAYAFASEVARAGYATAPNYESALHSVMRRIEAVH